jgi:hypothetical protein
MVQTKVTFLRTQTLRKKRHLADLFQSTGFEDDTKSSEIAPNMESDSEISDFMEIL